jgi:hypothetical protein
MAEVLLGQADRIFRWEGPKRKQTLLSAKLGRLVLTDERLVFLSTGKNDVTVARLLGGAVSPGTGLRTGSTEHLDVSALGQAGSLDLSLTRVANADLKGMFKVLTVTYWDEAGNEEASTFAPKNGGMPDGPAWVEAILAARNDALGGPE